MSRLPATLRRVAPVCLLFVTWFYTEGAAQSATPVAVTDAAKLESSNKPDFQQIALEKLFMTRHLNGASWSPDGKQVVFTSDLSGRMNLWTVPADGGFPAQLTVGEQRQLRPVWSPDGHWIAFQTDSDGDEMWDVYMVSPQTGESANVTMTRTTAEESPSWSPDGKLLAYSVRPKASPTNEIDVLDVATRRTRHITKDTPADRGNFRPIWSRDGKWLAWSQEFADEKHADICVAELATGKVDCLTQHKEGQAFRPAAWSPDGKSLLITSNALNGFDNVALLDVATRKLTWLTQDKWEMKAGSFSLDGKRLTWSANIDGNQALYAMDLGTRRPVEIPAGTGINSLDGIYEPFSPDGKQLLYMHEGATEPRDLWIYDFETGKSRQLTKSLVGGVRPDQMVEPTLVHYPSSDGKFTISALVYVPYNITRNAKFPAIVYIHGGPISQSVNNFMPVIQYMVNQGYVVIAPNYRGSSGFGMDFTRANVMDAGGGELRDIVDGAEFIKRSGFVDPKKLIVMGRSYGGYLTMMAVTKHPDLWAAGVPIVPFVNWFTEFQNEDPTLQESDRHFMGDPVKNKELWTDRSPFFFLDRVKAPLLLMAGGNDPRCPKEEAQQVASEIRKHGGVAQLKIYENEGHVFSRTENVVDSFKRIADFLKTYVPSPGCGCTVFE